MLILAFGVDGVLPPSSANGQQEHDETNEI